MKYLLVYLPVIHRGYLNFFEKYPGADILILDESLVELIDAEFDYLRKEIRSLSPQQALTSLQALLPSRNSSLLPAQSLQKLNNSKNELILPNEDIFRWLAKKHLDTANITFDSTFLRWNRDNTLKKRPLDQDSKIAQVVQEAQQKAALSSDWWRQVGSAIFSETANGIVKNITVSTQNKHLPHERAPYFDSDPRNSFHKGEHIELSTAIHAEAAAIAWCANEGISTKNKSMYVTTFPCPVCAKLIAQSGINKLYYSEGYSMLDGEKVLGAANILIIKL